MAGLKQNEVAISKCVSVELDKETVAIIGLMYHTANRKENPDDKSWYRYEGRIAKIADIRAEIEEMRKPENRMKDWKWPNREWPTEWFMGYDKSNDNMKGSKFLAMKLKKMLDWETYVRQVRDGVRVLANGCEKAYTGAKYETDDFVSDSGLSGINILDKGQLLSLCGQCVSKKLKMKRD